MNELEKRKLIEVHFRAGQTNKAILQSVGLAAISLRTIQRTVRKLQEGKTIERAKGSGRKLLPATTRSKILIKQRLKRNQRQSVRKIARETGTPPSTAQRIVSKYLHMSPESWLSVSCSPLKTESNVR